MSDFKTVEQLCYENPNLNSYILSLAGDMAKLKVNNIDLRNKIIELENCLSELRKYYKELSKL